MPFFSEIEKSILKYIWKHKIPGVAKTIMSKTSNIGGFTISDFKLYYRVIVTKKSMVLAPKQFCRPMEYNQPNYPTTE
jgi:hypothetical protein